MPGDNRDVEPPDPMPNSVVKRVIADGSVGLPHVRVGHRQAPNTKNPSTDGTGVFCLPGEAGKPGYLKEGGVTLTEGKTTGYI